MTSIISDFGPFSLVKQSRIVNKYSRPGGPVFQNTFGAVVEVNLNERLHVKYADMID